MRVFGTRKWPIGKDIPVTVANRNARKLLSTDSVDSKIIVIEYGRKGKSEGNRTFKVTTHSFFYGYDGYDLACCLYTLWIKKRCYFQVKILKAK